MGERTALNSLPDGYWRLVAFCAPAICLWVLMALDVFAGIAVLDPAVLFFLQFPAMALGSIELWRFNKRQAEERQRVLDDIGRLKAERGW